MELTGHSSPRLSDGQHPGAPEQSEDNGVRRSTRNNPRLGPISEYVIEDEGQKGNRCNDVGVNLSIPQGNEQARFVNGSPERTADEEGVGGCGGTLNRGPVGPNRQATVGIDRQQEHPRVRQGDIAAYRGTTDEGAYSFGPALALCPHCDALVERGTDCREALSCGAEPDAIVFEPYQPRHRDPYDLSNTYDRTELYLSIQRMVDRADDYLNVIHSLAARKALSSAEIRERMDETLATLGRHQRALCRLESIERKEGNSQ